MTTTHAAATRLLVNGAARRTIKVAVCTILAAAGLAGCGSSNLLGPSDTPSLAAAPVAAPQPAAPAASSSKVAVAAVMGAPDGVSKSVGAQLGSALERQRVTLAKDGDKADYTLRGYMVATKERSATKVSYIFDLTDPAGKRVNRIQGEEQAQGAGNDAWAAVTPELAQRITDKTASSLAAALSSLTPGITGSAPIGVGAASLAANAPGASLPGTAGASVPAAAAAAAVQTASLPAAAPSGPTTGSIDRGTAPAGLSAIVPAVAGAPGDGNTSLSDAMRQELQTSGVGSASPGQKAYNVAGKVTIGPVKDGKQPIKIDWRVTDPNGAHLATVSQNNEIQAGALDGPWGAIASDAAQGAAAKIKALIEENKAGVAAGGAARTKAVARSKT